MKRITPLSISHLNEDEIFVFGSNLQGRHGGGAARAALRWGAIMNQGIGLQGQTYAIPTMFDNVNDIQQYVDAFIEFAKTEPGKKFLVTRIGCGIAGYTPAGIAPMFFRAINIENIYLPQDFWDVLLRGKKPSQ